MRFHFQKVLSRLVSVAIFFALLIRLSAEPTMSPQSVNDSAAQATNEENGSVEQQEEQKQESLPRVRVDVARDRAKLLHDVYSSTLVVMHDRYFHNERAAIPAKAMEDVFEDIQKQSKIRANWISASLKAMSIHHEPKTDFEKRAAREIKEGKREVEVIEEGYYRRATAIALHGGCLHCHDGFLASSSPSAKFAGLVISIPVEEANASENKPFNNK